MEQLLRKEEIDKGVVLRAMLLMEELLMLIYEKNEGTRVSCECSIILSLSELTMILRDNGAEIDLTDEDAGISSLRCYVTSGLLHRWTRASRHLMTMTFNRNRFIIPLNSSTVLS